MDRDGKPYSPAGKRALDICVVLLSLPIVLPLMVVLAVLVGVVDGRPIFFLQWRPGRCGKLFEIWKLRTLNSCSAGDGGPSRDAQRMTRFGGWLRRTSLDELPELINVLKGDMSLVGPRPLLTQYLERYTPEQARRHEMRPGITGWAQVNGRNAISWEQKFEFDLWYVDNVSLLLDLKILWMTLGKILTGEGLTAEGHASMPEFTGTSDE